MTDETMGGIPPTILQFRWDLNAECNYEEVSGKPLISADGMFQIELRSPKSVRELVFAGLKSNVPGITLEDVGKLITAENSLEVYTFVFKTMKLASKPPEPPNAEAPATG
jgi:hypothetical protein